MRNVKNGFTLIELLAVLIVLAAIVAITTPVVTKTIKKSKNTTVLYSAKLYIDAVEKAVFQKNLDESFKPSKCTVNTSGSLTCDDIFLEIDADGKKPDKGKIEFYSREVTYAILEYGTKKIIINSNGEAVLGPICKLIEGKAKTVGSKYQCKVKNNMEEGFEEGYYFYVLSNNDDGTTNLIMDRNIYYNSDTDRGVLTSEKTGNVNWTSQEDYNDDVKYGTKGNNDKGPVTAMKYLYNATEDWDNVPYMIIDYDDEGNTGNYGYGGIKTEGKTTRITMKDGTVTATIENLKARLPKASEVSGEGLCGLYVEYSCPIWLNDYLGLKYPDQGTIVEGIKGFWTLSARVDSPSWAMRVLHKGRYAYGEVNSVTTSAGIRPVITLEI